MKRSLSLGALLLALVAAVLLQTGCENVSVGVGFSNYDPGSGVSYGFGVSRGPYGQTQSSFNLGFHGHP
jgi:hypothetical protein